MSTEFKNWYALSINMNKEKSAKSQLLARIAVMKDTNIQGVEYLQRKEIVVDSGGRKKIANRLLMSGYLLVQVKPEVVELEDGTKLTRFPGDTFKLITETPGIKFFVNCDQDKPIPFRPREIQKLFKLCEDTNLEEQLNSDVDYQIGDIVEVIQGPFKGYDIEVTYVNGDKVLGQLDMFGRTVPAEFTRRRVSLVKRNLQVSL